jgi:hypothetical protein
MRACPTAKEHMTQPVSSLVYDEPKSKNYVKQWQ